MAALLLLRHGQIHANRKGLWHGSTDTPLTWRGRRQVKATARHVHANHHPIAAIYTSPLARCLATAVGIAERLDMEPVIVDDLREYAIGEWEGLPFRDLAETHEFVDRATADPDFAPPGGESLRAVANRIVPAFERIHEAHATDERVLVVGHGAAMAVAMSTLLGGGPSSWVDYHFANCSLTELVLSPTPYVTFFNSTQHL
jgi:broad specificity phosphatase PhoE